MEFYANKDATVATKIFEVGLKTFDMEKDLGVEEYLLTYFDFLVNLNDDHSNSYVFNFSSP